jgi:hypothetical protein
VPMGGERANCGWPQPWLSRNGPPPEEDDGPTGLGDYNGALEMRTVAGPSSVVQWVLSGGPYTVASHVRHVEVVVPRRRARGTLDGRRVPCRGRGCGRWGTVRAGG